MTTDAILEGGLSWWHLLMETDVNLNTNESENCRVLHTMEKIKQVNMLEFLFKTTTTTTTGDISVSLN